MSLSGKSVFAKINILGCKSGFFLPLFVPITVSIIPDNRLLKNSPTLNQVRMVLDFSFKIPEYL